MSLFKAFAMGVVLCLSTAACSGLRTDSGAREGATRTAQEERLAALEGRVTQLEYQWAKQRTITPARDTPSPPPPTYRAVMTLLQSEIDRKQLSVERSGDAFIISLNDDLLFESGQARLKPAGVHLLKMLGNILRDGGDQRITVNGHTDNRPIGGRLIGLYPSNQALSLARAGNAMRALQAGGAPADRMTAVGYGDTRPLTSNETEAGRQKNRRVEIVVSPGSFR